MRKNITSLALAFGLLLGLAPIARADATVVVELKRKDGTSAEGTIYLVKGDARLSCKTDGGRCAIQGVSGGSYRVEVEQPGKTAPKGKTVMIPPSGEVKLIVAAAD